MRCSRSATRSGIGRKGLRYGGSGSFLWAPAGAPCPKQAPARARTMMRFRIFRMANNLNSREHLVNWSGLAFALVGPRQPAQHHVDQAQHDRAPESGGE